MNWKYVRDYLSKPIPLEGAAMWIQLYELRRILLEPIPMILHCPRCGQQHVDAPDPKRGWDNPPHKSHECQFCLTIWRPADMLTVGVEKIETRGRADTWPESGIKNGQVRTG